MDIRVSRVRSAVGRWGPVSRGFVALCAGSAAVASLAAPARAVDEPTDRVSPVVARWGLETYPGVNQAAALADQQPALAGDTPLTANGVAWADDVRLLDARTATFDGATSTMATNAAVLDPNGSFSVAAWVRLGLPGQALPNVNKAAVVQDGNRVSSFILGYRGATRRWAFWLHSTDRDNSAAVWVNGRVPTPGQWTHLAGIYDATEKQLRIYVNGELSGTAAVPVAPAWSTARAVTLGRELWNRAPTARWQGSIADVQLYNRALVTPDFTGWEASDPGSGGFDEPSILSPVPVGEWSFGAAVPCYDPAIPDTCDAPEFATWGRRFTLRQGAYVDSDRSGGSALFFDATHWIDDPADPYYGMATQEYAWTQHNTAAQGEPPVWQDTPVVRTDQSFSVSAWVRLADLPAADQTVVSQDGVEVSGFSLGISRQSGAAHWSVQMRDSDNGAAAARAVLAQPALTGSDLGRWIHLVGVYNAARRDLRLYVDGVPRGTVARVARPWHANGVLAVGRGLHGGAPVQLMTGGVDDVFVYAGALTDVEVSRLHEDQAPRVPPG